MSSRFHEIEPQSSVMELLRPSQLSRKVLAPPRGTVPASELASNTLVLSGGQGSERFQDATAQAWGVSIVKRTWHTHTCSSAVLTQHQGGVRTVFRCLCA